MKRVLFELKKRGYGTTFAGAVVEMYDAGIDVRRINAEVYAPRWACLVALVRVDQLRRDAALAPAACDEADCDRARAQLLDWNAALVQRLLNLQRTYALDEGTT